MGSVPHGRCAVDARYPHRACEAEGRQGAGYWQRAKRPLLKVLIRVTSCCLAVTSIASAEFAQVLDVVSEAQGRVPEFLNAYGVGDLAKAILL